MPHLSGHLRWELMASRNGMGLTLQLTSPCDTEAETRISSRHVGWGTAHMISHHPSRVTDRRIFWRSCPLLTRDSSGHAKTLSGYQRDGQT